MRTGRSERAYPVVDDPALQLCSHRAPPRLLRSEIAVSNERRSGADGPGMGTASSMISFAAELLASVVAPPRCAACDAPVSLLATFCAACASTVESAPQEGAYVFAAFFYGGAVARAITRLKYERRPDLARPLGDLLWRALQPHASALRGALVIPVPLHAMRLAERGFNQSTLIARRVARRLGVPLLPLALARIRDTPKQAALDREARIANVAGAFLVRQRERVRRKSVLLVDDVRTTGATMEACASALMTAGAASVVHAVVADVIGESSGSKTA